MAEISIRQAHKYYGKFHAVNDFDITIKDGEFLSILGPSGCGKTTLLRSIAGFFPLDSGVVNIGKQTVESPAEHIHISPEDRNIGMVFQSYAVWPHMNVFDNIAYPLKIRKESGRVIKEKVDRVIDMLNLSGNEKKFPSAMSGGQQQRIALGRALVMDPDVLLLDEPLSNLDSKLREKMRFELKEIQQRLNLTILYVTHDQEEAMAVSDRIVLMDKGQIQQVGTPRELYSCPENLFSARFMGRSNQISGTLLEQDGKKALVQTSDKSQVPVLMENGGDFEVGEDVTAILRYEQMEVIREESGADSVSGRIAVGTYFGSYFLYVIETPFGEYVAHTDAFTSYQPGDSVSLRFSGAYLFADS